VVVMEVSSHGTQKCSSDMRTSNELHSFYDCSGLNWRKELPIILMPRMTLCVK